MTMNVAGPRGLRGGKGRAAAAVAALATAAAVHADHTLTLHVDDDAAAGGDGLSWAAPFQNLQDALDAARQAAATRQTLERVDILIAQGTYRPDRGTGSPDDAFSIILDQLLGRDIERGEVSLIGGYGGVTEPNPAAQNPAIFRTVLSGDLNEDDQPGFVNYEDNSHRVLSVGWHLTSGMAFTMDSLTVRGGGGSPGAFVAGGGVSMAYVHGRILNCIIEGNRSNYYGAGIRVTGGDLSIERSVVRRNRASESAGGLHSSADDLLIRHSLFTENEATMGAGVAVSRGQVAIEDSTFSENVASVAGGGVYQGDFFPSARVERTRFVANAAPIGAGAFASGTFIAIDSVFAHNDAQEAGGAIYVTGQDEATLSCCTVAYNKADRGAAVAYVDSGYAKRVVGSILWANSSREEPGSVLMQNAGAVAFHSTVLPGLTAGITRIGDSGEASTVGCIDLDPLFADADGPDDDPATWEDNDLSLRAASPAIDRGARVAGLSRAFDLVGNPRSVDVPAVPNSGNDPIDMGAIEFVPCPCDADNDETITVLDLLSYLDWWFASHAYAEQTGNHRIDVFDLLAFLDCWFADEGCE